jgi:L-cystine uptake protein TcyP (sodium:dicarboxylate symporter family)
VEQVENKSLRVTTTIIIMITMNIDCGMTLKCIYNPNNNNEIHIP